MSTDTNTTPATDAIKARLSCRHVVDVEQAEGTVTDPEALVDETVECGKCPALKKSGGQPTRRIKAIVTAAAQVPAEEPEAPAAQADAPTEPEASPETVAEAPKAEAKRGPRVVKASAEARQLKDWKEAGEQGDRPATPNLDAIEAEKTAEAADKAAEADGRKPGTDAPDPANPLGLGVAQGPVGMVNSADMTADAPTTAKRTRKSRAPEGRVTDLNLSPVRRIVMLQALPEAPEVPSVAALRAAVAGDAKRVDVDADGVRALLTGLSPICKTGDKAACKLVEWLSKFAEQVGWTAPQD